MAGWAKTFSNSAGASSSDAHMAAAPPVPMASRGEASGNLRRSAARTCSRASSRRSV